MRYRAELASTMPNTILIVDQVGEPPLFATGVCGRVDKPKGQSYNDVANAALATWDTPYRVK